MVMQVCIASLTLVFWLESSRSRNKITFVLRSSLKSYDRGTVFSFNIEIAVMCLLAPVSIGILAVRKRNLLLTILNPL